MTELETLRSENEWLRERVEMLTGRMDEKERIRQTLRVTPQQAAIIKLLSSRLKVSHETVYHNVFDDGAGNGPQDPIARVQISTLRKKLRQQGAPEGIESIWGWGYRMTPELKGWIMEKLA